MKSKFALIAGSCLVFLACSRPARTGAPLNVNVSRKSEILNGQSQNYTYEIALRTCGTGKRQFSSTDELCRALQNNALNNNCALDERKQLFAKSCPGRSFVEISGVGPSAEKTTDGALPEKFQNRSIKTGQYVMEVPVTSPKGGNSIQSELTFVTCVESVNDGLATSNNGIIIVKGSRVVLTRDTSYKFGDGTNSSQAKPFSQISCTGTADSRAQETISQEHQARKLTAGQAIMEVVKTSPTGAGDMKSALTFVTCMADAVSASESGYNGISLLKGSKLVVMRDTNYRFGDGTSSSKALPVSVISCD